MGLRVTSQTAHGPVNWYYVLSTPSKTLAPPNELDKHVPTVLVLVPGFSLLVSAHRTYFIAGNRGREAQSEVYRFRSVIYATNLATINAPNPASPCHAVQYGVVECRPTISWFSMLILIATLTTCVASSSVSRPQASKIQPHHARLSGKRKNRRRGAGEVQHIRRCERCGIVHGEYLVG